MPIHLFKVIFSAGFSFPSNESGYTYAIFRSSHSEVLLKKGVLKICGKLTGEHPCRSAISIKLQRY